MRPNVSYDPVTRSAIAAAWPASASRCRAMPRPSPCMLSRPPHLPARLRDQQPAYRRPGCAIDQFERAAQKRLAFAPLEIAARRDVDRPTQYTINVALGTNGVIVKRTSNPATCERVASRSKPTAASNYGSITLAAILASRIAWPGPGVTRNKSGTSSVASTMPEARDNKKPSVIPCAASWTYRRRWAE